jgi:bifunctional non-homologous end joining protein LigD
MGRTAAHQAHLRGGEPTIYTRTGHYWSERQPIAAALTKVQANHLVIDEEVVVLDPHGVPDFAALHTDLSSRRSDRLLYYAFDLLYLDGFDLRASPLLERKRASKAGASGSNRVAAPPCGRDRPPLRPSSPIFARAWKWGW